KEERSSSAAEALTVLGDPVSASPPVVPPEGRSSFRTYLRAGALVVMIVFAVLIGRTMFSAGDGPVPQEQQLASGPSVEAVPETTAAVHDTGAAQHSVPSFRREQQSVVPSVVPVRQDSGTMFLTSSPWAKVFINERQIGETPLSAPVLLPAGKYTVMFTNPSFDPIVRTVVVEAGKEIAVNGDFIGTAGYLQCVVKPWAEVFVNEVYKETTPFSKPLMLSPGKYTVRLQNAAFPDIIREVMVRSGDTTTLTVTFTP
ncbi:MAG: PEGA domain-containing protein, partial [Bacteroidetes bacterium]|nr:PEGA domain-containing protein [Bacteroidota bacterium]